MSDMWYVLFKMLPFIIIVDFLTENLIMLLGSHTYSTVENFLITRGAYKHTRTTNTTTTTTTKP